MIGDLESDVSNLERLPHKKLLKSLFQKYQFVYTPNYELQKLDNIASAGATYLPDKKVRFFYNNLDYRLLAHYNYEKKIVRDMIDLVNFLVTSMDQQGVKSPLNKSNSSIHPGGKRLLIARYLNLPTVPVLEQNKKLLNKDDGNVKSVKDLFKIYSNDISIKIRNQKLEVSWHGESKLRDNNGYDDWFSASRNRDGNTLKIREYLLENGLEIVNNFIEKEQTSDIFVTKFVKQPTNKIYFTVTDEKLLSYDFWELFYHIDPTVYKKTCKSQCIEIHNHFIDNTSSLENCNLLNTLNRTKIKF